MATPTESLEKLEDAVVRRSRGDRSAGGSRQGRDRRRHFWPGAGGGAGTDYLLPAEVMPCWSDFPGLAKTKLVDTLGVVLGLEARRIQFTPDLMPSDILGSEVLEESPGGRRSFRFIAGPIFA